MNRVGDAAVAWGPEVAVGTDELCLQNLQDGVPAAAQWVENPTVAALFAVEAWIQSLAQHSELKDPELLQL